MESLERSMPPGPALEALKRAQEQEIASVEQDDHFADAWLQFETVDLIGSDHLLTMYNIMLLYVATS